MNQSHLSKLGYTLMFALLLASTISAQQFVGMGAAWSNSFSEWQLYIEDFEGTLHTVWADDLTEWRYQIDDDTYGTIRLKWKDDPSNWEIRGNDGTLITARTIWPNSLREWRLTDNDKSVELKPKWGNVSHEWIMSSRSYGSFYIYQDWEGDPREWTIEDEASELSPHMKMGLLFISMFQSITE